MPDAARLPRLFRFLIVGAAGFVVDAGLSNLLIAMGQASPLIARIPAFTVATVVTYSANREFTFHDRQTPFVSGWLKYVSSTSIGAILNYLVFSLAITFVVHGSWAVLEAIGLGSIAGLAFNYVCSVRLVFTP